MDQLTEDTYQYKFELPGNSSLGLSLGQHIVLRYCAKSLVKQATVCDLPCNFLLIYKDFTPSKSSLLCSQIGSVERTHELINLANFIVYATLQLYFPSILVFVLEAEPLCV